jgi:hypothetical protein
MAKLRRMVTNLAMPLAPQLIVLSTPDGRSARDRDRAQ